jgi:hypothetical protein
VAEVNPASEGQGVASARANRTRVHRRLLRDLLRIDSTMDFHRYGIEHAISRYRVLRDEQGLGLGTVLSIGSTYREARRFVEHPFEEICLTGILDADDELHEIASSDPRARYEKQNCERLAYASGSFDLVFCKESLHHPGRSAFCSAGGLVGRIRARVARQFHDGVDRARPRPAARPRTLLSAPLLTG